MVWLKRGDPARTRFKVGVPTTVPIHRETMEEVMQVIIGIDPHKATHTAVAVSGDEDELARLKLRASRGQVDKLLTWAAPFPLRTWAIEGAEGLGFLLAQQLVTAGETVVDVPATLAARTRVERRAERRRIRTARLGSPDATWGSDCASGSRRVRRRRSP